MNYIDIKDGVDYTSKSKYTLLKYIKITVSDSKILKGIDYRSTHYYVKDGNIEAYEGYYWDGASGPTIDSKSSMYASLKHDIFYDLLRRQVIPMKMRKRIDKEFYRDLKNHGMTFLRRYIWYRAVRIFGKMHLGRIQ